MGLTPVVQVRSTGLGFRRELRESHGVGFAAVFGQPRNRCRQLGLKTFLLSCPQRESLVGGGKSELSDGDFRSKVSKED